MAGARAWCEDGENPAERLPGVILPNDRDPRSDPGHGNTHRLGSPAPGTVGGVGAEHVLDRFEAARPEDLRPRQAIEQGPRLGARREHHVAGSDGGRPCDGRGQRPEWAGRHAAYAAGQAAVVAHVAAHVAAHELGAAAYAIKAARAAAPQGEGEHAGRVECRWQRDQLPGAIRELVLDDQRIRNDICWSVFAC